MEMAGVSAENLKQVASKAIDDAADELYKISQDIWSHPELAFEEHHAHQVLTNFLEEHGLPIERHFVSTTGFRSVYGSKSGPNISVLCEYDSLPEIGHACGHNLIAEAGVGAALGIKAALDAARTDLGTLTVLGTPAEESGGGKIQMIKAGVFDDIDLAMMVHPTPDNLVDVATTARQSVKIRYHGRASHAAAYPWQGINALDAAVMAYNGISVMRQQVMSTWRIHGVITNGGAKPNIIPEYTELEYYVRAPTIIQVEQLKEKATACFEAAAKATGCTVDLEWEPDPYYNMVSNQSFVSKYTTNATAMGMKMSNVPKLNGGSTDMGNVSQVIPSIHPVFNIGTDVAIHTREFAVVAGSPAAQPFTLTQAKLLAMTAIDVYCQPHLVETMKTELQETLENQQ